VLVPTGLLLLLLLLLLLYHPFRHWHTSYVPLSNKLKRIWLATLNDYGWAIRAQNVHDGKLMWPLGVTTVPHATELPPLIYSLPSLVLKPSCSDAPSVSTLSCYRVLQSCNLWQNTLLLLSKYNCLVQEGKRRRKNTTELVAGNTERAFCTVQKISATQQKHALPSSLLSSLTTLSQVLKLHEWTDYELWFGTWNEQIVAHFKAITNKCPAD
jgi:hypothetical protein